MGTRFTSGRSPRRFTSRASSDGVATPVTVVVKMTSTSVGSRPTSANALRTALAPELGADADEGVVGPSKGEVRIVLHREGQVAPSDGHSLVESSQSVDVVMGLRPLLNKRRDQCVLVVVVAG